ncbi:hypothetical protein GCM10007932_38180 [Vibrio penaeicida]|uniref:Uncharacterized protein n=1 Tax=Vibrio penaeicida TaxID=104609 RepID=A0AAV5NW11_9VIBR|nr:hypothetical protein GCM10007932_38180 [Vibrio penaeicida]
MKDEIKMIRDLKEMNLLVDRLAVLMREALEGSKAQDKAA